MMTLYDKWWREKIISFVTNLNVFYCKNNKRVRTCSVPGCRSESYSGCNISFYSFPKNENIKIKWQKNLNITRPITKFSKVCSLHFDPTSFYTPNSLRLLKKDAIPIPAVVSFTARGLVPPVFTPLNDDLTVNYAAIPGYAKYLADSGIKAVLVGGTTGEHMSLDVATRKAVVDAWVAAAKTTKLHIMVQVGGAPLPNVTELASYCQSAGADSLLTLPELYFKPGNVQELVSYVELVAQAAPKLPVLYYHIPHMSGVKVNMPTFVKAATARIPNFKGIKFTCNDLNEGAQVLQCLVGDQEMFLGADTLLAPAALLGAKSSIGTTYSLFPRLAQDILDAVEANEVEKARSLQQKLTAAIEAHTAEGAWVPVMKAGMEIATGIKVGPPSLPQRPVSAEAKQRIQGKLRPLGLAK